MYKNIIAELAREGYKRKILSEIWKCNESTVYGKLNGKYPITVKELKIAKDKLFPELDLEYLAETDDEKNAKT